MLLSSPAARAASARRSRRRLKEAGYTVAANYAGNDDAAKSFTAETGIKTYKWSAADYDACEAGIKPGRGRPRPGRGAGEQRRHHPRRAVPQDDAGAVEGGHRHQPHRRLQHDPPGLAGHARPQVRPRSSPSPRSTARRASSPRRTTRPPRRAISASQARWRRRARATTSPSTSWPRLHRHRDGDGGSREGARVDHCADSGGPPRRADEIARAVVFLASDDAGFITGSTISANGGQFFA